MTRPLAAPGPKQARRAEGSTCPGAAQGRGGLAGFGSFGRLDRNIRNPWMDGMVGMVVFRLSVLVWFWIHTFSMKNFHHCWCCSPRRFTYVATATAFVRNSPGGTASEKALAVNLDSTFYGSFAEIGAGQEVWV